MGCALTAKPLYRLRKTNMDKVEYIYKDFKIELINDIDYSSNSTDNLIKYNFEYCVDDESFPNVKYGLLLKRNDKVFNSCILLTSGGFSSLHKNCFSINNDKIFICIGKSISCIELPTLKLLWKKEIDTAICFEIYNVSDDFVIFGECSISRINKNGTIIWQYFGEDIFTNFNLKENFIIAQDYKKKIYNLSLDGKVLL